jgi:glycosyltransferase involved in cell wall biosynthesis
MKLLHLLPTLERRGAQVFARDLIGGLAAHGDVAQSLIVLSTGPDEVDMARVTGHIRTLASRGAVGRMLALRQLLHDNPPDILFAHGGAPFKCAVLARGRATTPKIVYRKIGLSEQWLGRLRWLKLPFQRWLIRRADAISTVGETTRHEAIELFRADAEKLRVIYRGVDAERFTGSAETREQVRAELGMTRTTRVLIAVGALGWEKNQGTMLRVLAEVRKSYSNAVLLLAGDGPERPKLEQLAAELGVADVVRFLGVRQDVPELLAAADLFLLTSLTEGVPGVLIEAGMAGLPCVTWDVAGAKEVIKDGVTGRVTPYRDETAFTVAVIDLLSHAENASAMGCAARYFCRERFSLKRCVEEHVRMFDELMKHQ